MFCAGARRALQILISPVRVQGIGAAAEIAVAIRELSYAESRNWPALDLIVVTRGGGSIEDLWEFNVSNVSCPGKPCHSAENPYKPRHPWIPAGS